VQGVIRRDNDARVARQTAPHCVALVMAFFLRHRFYMGSLSKLLLLVLMILMPGGLVVAALAWLADRWRKQRLLAAAPIIHV
jgi:hypothetical protein